jgi:NADPH2:quinone reductase
VTTVEDHGMNNFKALRIHREAGRIQARYEQLALEDLAPGEVVVRVAWSGINYKDALAATGTSPILRRYPLVGGIDLSGEVVSSTDARYTPGQKVLVTGCGLSETHDGGYAEYARLPGDWLIALPPGMDEMDVMKLGTAGFTAALAIQRMEHNGQRPSGGPIVVTGASGGVGSIAINMLAGRGYEVVAVSGKPDAEPYLRELGAHRVLRRQDVDLGSRPMEAALWAGAIDNVGGETLTWLTRTVDFWGNIASIGLAGSHELHTTVLPFILRGVSLLGINSVATPRETRLAVWQRIGTDLRPAKLDRIATRVVDFADLLAQFDGYLKGQVTGRTVVRIRQAA